MPVHNRELRNKINKAAHKSMCNAYSISSITISACVTGIAIWGVLTKTKDPLYATLGITILNSLLKLARLLYLHRDNTRLRHYFFATAPYTGNTIFNIQIEQTAVYTAPCVGIFFSILGLGLLSLKNGQVGEIFSLSVPFTLEALSAISESILDTANSKLRNLYDMKDEITLINGDSLTTQNNLIDNDVFVDSFCQSCC